MFKNFLLVLLGLTVSLVATELTLRAIGYAGEDERLKVVFDTDFGEIQKADWLHNFPKEHDKQEVVKIYDQEVVVRKSKDLFRVLFLGDSGTFGVYVPSEKPFPQQIGKLLKEKLPTLNSEVINAGIIGMNTVDEFHLLNRKLKILDPDVVVVGIFLANDINFNLRSKEMAPQKTIDTFTNTVKANSALFHFVNLKLKMLNQKFGLMSLGLPVDEKLSPVWNGAPNSENLPMLNYFTGEIALYKKNYSELATYSFEFMERILLKFKELANESDFNLIFVAIPSPSTIENQLRISRHPDALSELSRDYGVNISFDQLDFEKPIRLLADICKRNSLTCINPLQEIRSSIGAKAIIDGDDHLTIEGHEILAKMIFDYIHSNL